MAGAAKIQQKSQIGSPLENLIKIFSTSFDEVSKHKSVITVLRDKLFSVLFPIEGT